MPVMSDQVRKARAERLLVLRFEEKMSPSAAWLKVRPTSKAGDIQAGELTRREIRWLQSRRETAADEAGDDPIGATVTAETAAEVVFTEGAAAAPPKKRCVGVGVEDDSPCGRAISGRSPRCDDCRKERRRLKRKRYNRDYYRRRKERLIREAEKRNALSTLAVVLCLVLERRQEEAAQREREAAAAARVVEVRAEIRAMLEAERKAEEKRRAKRIRIIEFVPGEYRITRHPDGRREYHDLRTEYSRFLEPGEHVPRPGPRYADHDIVRSWW